MLYNGRKLWLRSAYEKPGAAWKPSGDQARVNQKKLEDRNKSGELAWNMVGEVVRLAEGRDQVTLGRIHRQHKTYRHLE